MKTQPRFDRVRYGDERKALALASVCPVNTAISPDTYAANSDRAAGVEYISR